MAPKNRARQQPGNMRSRQQAKLNSQRAQNAPIQPAGRTGPRRQLPPSTQGGTRVGNSSQPWGDRAGERVQQVKVREVGRPQLPAAQTVPENRRLPGMQGPQPANRPQQPGTSRPTPDRRAAAEAKAAEAAKGTRSTSIKIGEVAKGGRMGGAAEAALYTAGNAAIDWYGNALRKAIQNERSQRAAESGQRGRYVPGNQQVKFEKPEQPKKPANKPPAAPARTTSDQPSTAVRNPGPARQQPPAKPSTPAPTQSKNMDENYAAWATANQGLAAKVKKGQAGYEAVQKALDKLKIKGKK